MGVGDQGAFVAGGESGVISVPQFVKAVQRVMKDIMTEPPTPGRGDECRVGQRGVEFGGNGMADGVV